MLVPDCTNSLHLLLIRPMELWLAKLAKLPGFLSRGRHQIDAGACGPASWLAAALSLTFPTNRTRTLRRTGATSLELATEECWFAGMWAWGFRPWVCLRSCEYLRMYPCSKQTFGSVSSLSPQKHSRARTQNHQSWMTPQTALQDAMQGSMKICPALGLPWTYTVQCSECSSLPGFCECFCFNLFSLHTVRSWVILWHGCFKTAWAFLTCRE